MIHSEVSEAVEDYRVKRMEVCFEPSGKPVGFPVELADIIIRTLDLAGHYGIDIESAIELKINYNRTRSYRHGNKRA